MSTYKQEPMKIDKYYKKCELPHIAYTVYFKDLSELQGVEIKGGAYTVAFDKHTTVIFLPKIEKISKQAHNFPMIAHEVMHAIQNICEYRLMDITTEKEHTAYITAYLLNTITGYDYNLDF